MNLSAMSGLFLIVVFLLTRFQFTMSSESACTRRLKNCSCLKPSHTDYQIQCSYENQSFIQVTMMSPFIFIKCENNPSWSNFHYIWPKQRAVYNLYFRNCNAPSKFEDKLRIANTIYIESITVLRYFSFNGSIYSHNLEAYPNLSELDFYDSDVRDASPNFLKGITNLMHISIFYLIIMSKYFFFSPEAKSTYFSPASES